MTRPIHAKDARDYLIGGVVQSAVREHDQVPSSDPMMPVHYTSAFHCEDCGHVFPVEALMRIGHCGICRGRMLPGYSHAYEIGREMIEQRHLERGGT